MVISKKIKGRYFFFSQNADAWVKESASLFFMFENTLSLRVSTLPPIHDIHNSGWKEVTQKSVCIQV